MTARYPIVAVYADESCLGNGRNGQTPGALGVLVEYRRNDGTLQRFDLWDSEPDTTNNRMALRSVIDAFRALSKKGNQLSVKFTTDSRYIVDGMNEWVPSWIARGWKRKGGTVENLELWQEAVDTVRKHEVQWRWVRGHNGHPQNEYANYLATRAAKDQNRSDGLVASGFEEWMAAESARTGKAPETPDPFPTADTFQPARALPR